MLYYFTRPTQGVLSAKSGIFTDFGFSENVSAIKPQTPVADIVGSFVINVGLFFIGGD